MKMKKTLALVMAILLPLKLNGVDDQVTSGNTSNAVQDLISAAQIALDMPKKLPDFKENMAKLSETSKCLKNISAANCKSIGCSDTTACVGAALGHFVELLNPTIEVLLGKATTKKVEKDGKLVDTIEYSRGLIASVLFIIPQLVPKLLNALPESVKSHSSIKGALNSINQVINIINTSIVPKLATFTDGAQNTAGIIDSFAFMFNPEAAISKTPPISLPPVEIPAEEEEDLSFE